MLTPGLRASVSAVVTAVDTARALGSGDVPVLATPRLVALCEAATVAAVAPVLEPGTTTVGTRVEVDHLAASPVGSEVEAAAELVEVAGRRLRFEVVARSGDATVGRASVTRLLVDRAGFLERAGARDVLP